MSVSLGYLEDFVMNHSVITPIKLFFAISSRFTPFFAIRAAEKLFTTPFHSKRRDVEDEILERAEKFFIPMEKGRQLTAFRWGKKTDPVVLFVHGWTATATCFVNFIEPLLAKGYQVISYDSIAHGDTSGLSVSLTEWADTVLAAMKEIGKVHCIVGHSLGSGAIVIASSLNLRTDKLVLISPVTDIGKVTEKFAEALSIPKRIMEKMHQYAWKKYNASASKYGKDWNDVFESSFNVPTLIIHDINDNEIDISNARKLAKQWDWAELIETRQLGHRRILINHDVVTSALNFIVDPNIQPNDHVLS